MPLFSLTVNGRTENVDVARGTPLLWVLRDHLGLTGTKYGCGIGQCGTCTIHVAGQAARACSLPIEQLGTRPVTTIEGLSERGDHPLQRAWVAEQVPQCGYCQSGQIMAAAALLVQIKRPTAAEVDAQMDGVICRCGTYARIRRAIDRAAQDR